MNHILAASTLMQVVNVLGNDSQLGHMLRKLSDSEVSTIWLCLQNLVTAPFVPSPT
jgi:hypothetical protein